MQADRLTYTVDEAVRATGICKTSIFNLMKAGTLARVKVGKRTLIPAKSLQALVQADGQ